ncbi:type II secretion system protein GspM [Thiorhodospira sibirica]|uniref:type II secretion system protein GspM n=1 Tax=Thiorhodospira sibirica TaxID=154347 RepID=UPI00022C3A08|nr:type II secretion system protein GspM [Thiorhodospira sibirica]
MDIETLSPGRQRILALAILMSLVLAFGLLVLKPIVGLVMHYATAIEDVSFRIERLSAQVAREPGLRHNVAELEGLLNAQGWYFEPENPSLIAARLQESLSRILRTHGGQLSSSQVLEPRAQDGLRVIGLRLRILANSQALANIIYDIETAIPLMFIDDLTIRALPAPAHGGDWLDIQLQISALMRT